MIQTGTTKQITGVGGIVFWFDGRIKHKHFTSIKEMAEFANDLCHAIPQTCITMLVQEEDGGIRVLEAPTESIN